MCAVVKTMNFCVKSLGDFTVFTWVTNVAKENLPTKRHSYLSIIRTTDILGVCKILLNIPGEPIHGDLT